MKIPTRDLVYLAGLLHDVGKFGQRADANGVKASLQLSEETKRLVDDYCPKHKDGYPTHVHVMWTAQFLEDLGIGRWQDEKGNSLARIACRHHVRELVGLERLIQVADHLSSGMDRLEKAGKEEGEQEVSQDRQAFKKQRMCSVFEYLGDDPQDGKLPPAKYHLPLAHLNQEHALIPKEKFDEAPDYATLWQSFLTDSKDLATEDVGSFAENICFLLERYTSTVPSSTIHLPDVSLFDHLKTTGGLALCLHDFMASASSQSQLNERGLPKEDAEAFLLIGADLSGIQDFIYNIPSKGAAKQLKARSFFLQALMEGILIRLLEQLGLYRGNVIYNSGGGFHLLAANTPENLQKLDVFRQELEAFLWKEYETDLYVALDWVPMRRNDFMIKAEGAGLSKQWQALSQALSQRKGSRYAALSKREYSQFFEPNALDAVLSREPFTGKALQAQDQTPLDREDLEVIMVSRKTKRLEDLGKQLKKSSAMVLSKEGIHGFDKTLLLKQIGGSDLYLTLIEKDQEQVRVEAGSYVMGFNDTDPKQLPVAIQTGHAHVRGFTWLGGNDFPDATFEHLCKGGEGITRLGILRMDVDGLGYIFSQGLGQQRYTLSRLATLSRSLDWFFRGYLNDIISQPGQFIDYPIAGINTAHHKHLNLIYAGGDDLFLLGRWDVVLNMAQAFRKAFARFTCENSRLGLSGGLVLVPPKYPIVQAARHADESERRAKSHETHLNQQRFEKDSLALFGTPLHWKHELPLVLHLYMEMEGYMREAGLNKSLIGHLGQFYTMWLDKRNRSWKWLSAYQLGRMKNDAKNKDVSSWLGEVQKSIYEGNRMPNEDRLPEQRHFLEYASIAARLTEIAIRNQE